jgi:hypothetical protein
MKSVFFESRNFTVTRPQYLNEDEYAELQSFLLNDPEAGDVMPGTGGFRKLRWADSRRRKGRRGGLRVIYYWIANAQQVWMFAVYDKNEMIDLSASEKKALKRAIDTELRSRGEI